MKTCTRCSASKAEEDFYKDKAQCKACVSETKKRWRESNLEKARAIEKAWRKANPEKVKAGIRAWKKANPERVLKSKRKSWLRKYRLEPEDFAQLRANQQDKCVICQDGFRALPHVDHDHKTGKVRGLLCRNCNLVLGFAFDSPSRLIAAAAYLKKTS